MWITLSAWVCALRLRTLSLALSSITIGALLAVSLGAFSMTIYVLALLTAILLQILSNMANDYGDAVHGADHDGRVGPVRGIQSGYISKEMMKRALIVIASLCLASGALLLWVALASQLWKVLFFFGLGLSGIWAAISYTVGKKPYGYAGLGDLFVFLFFGPVGVLGSQYLFSQQFFWVHVLPAISFGALSVTVLNINNIRDMESDRKAGKHSIPVRIGKQKAILYHFALLGIAMLSMLAHTIITYHAATQLLFLLVIPLLLVHSMFLYRKLLHALDPLLKYMVFIIIVFVCFFAVGVLY